MRCLHVLPKHWNAITEHFVRDIDNAFIRITVKTALEFERDPVLGTKVISLKDLFTDQEAKVRKIHKKYSKGQCVYTYYSLKKHRNGFQFLMESVLVKSCFPLNISL
jgi:hypothetical protein